MKSEDIDDPMAMGANIKEDTHNDFWLAFEDAARGESGLSGDDKPPKKKKRNPSKTNSYIAEIERYLATDKIDRNEDPISWWREHKDDFSMLMPMVLKFLSAPPSSVDSERVFSDGGRVYTENRNKLKPENAEKLIFVMQNARNI